MFDSIDDTRSRLSAQGYFADPGLTTSLFLALRMQKALFLEGEPGVGKTEVARVLSTILDTPLIRLQCYEGLDITHAVYEWNYPRQLMEIQARSAAAGGRATGEAPADAADIFSEEFLLRRPLLEAIHRSHEKAPVLLIDELDRADEEFESFLLELLGDFQITVPEIGTFTAEHPPVVIITSNRTREIHDALKRRCIYHWIDYPSADQELAIVREKVPEAEERLARDVVDFVQRLRDEDLYKLPGVAESLDWARALTHLSAHRLDAATVDRTLGLILKYQDDVDQIRGARTAAILEAVQEG
ncbi:MAG: MoxR family ATPase [Gemmatimonadota bacterium]|nr:MoxR family ATPase [Gemmatimonadota bacterium]MDH5758061.1 MoxR family ATPase [Gemmatimonadota bacterium]